MDYSLDAFNPHAIARDIAIRMKKRRLEQGFTQLSLARRSGVSLGSLKRFELTFEISLRHMIMLATVLDAADGFSGLFARRHYGTIGEVLDASGPAPRKRGKRNG